MPCHNAQHYISDYEYGLDQLKRAYRCLGLSVSGYQLEQWASVMVQAFSGPGRYFHGPEHSFGLARRACQVSPYQNDGVVILAALFHDTVYCNIDGGLPPTIAAVLHPLLDWRDDTFSLKFPALGTTELSIADPSVLEVASSEGAAAQPRDSGRRQPRRYDVAALVTFLFGLPEDSEQTWSAAEQNEYLSALWACQLMAPVLSLGQVAEIAVAIEATIPFRGLWRGQHQSERRYARLQQANERFELGFSDAQIEAAIHRSVHLTNCDLESFAAEDPLYFLDQTWLLLPELNPALRNPHSYRAEDYRQALQRMEAFMARLDSQQIFQQFQEQPAAAMHRTWGQRAHHNLEVAQLYLTAKVVAIGLIEALHDGQDQSLSLARILGEISSIYGTSTWEQRFPTWPVSQPLRSVVEAKVLQVAEEGRITPCTFDSLRSPLTSFLIRSIGFERIQQLRDRMQLFFDGKITADRLLRGCEAKVVQATSQILQPLS